MRSDFDTASRAARRSYEIGRLWTSLRRAAMAVVVVAIVTIPLLGREALVWLPVTFFAVVATEWRGVWLMRGARRGLVVGLASMLLPLSILRPCCGMDAKAMGMSCCIMPSACWTAGALVGVGMSLFLPKTKAGDERGRWEAAAGMIVGVTAVAVLRCSMLFLGEALGLVGGMAAAMAAATLARWVLARVRTAR
ncbi:MAG: hypothetical protein KF819_35400 [Labilithrix sp.]|nr:hypothetical protein [Labilithrix sp.]